MPTFLQRPPRFGAAKLRTEAAKAPRCTSLPDAPRAVTPTRIAAPPARAAVLRPINLERRARFARMEADAPRGA